MIEVTVTNQPHTWGYEEMTTEEMAVTAQLFAEILQEELRAKLGDVQLIFSAVDGDAPTVISAPTRRIARKAEACLKRSWERMAGSPEWAALIGDIELQRPANSRSPF